MCVLYMCVCVHCMHLCLNVFMVCMYIYKGRIILLQMWRILCSLQARNQGESTVHSYSKVQRNRTSVSSSLIAIEDCYSSSKAGKENKLPLSLFCSIQVSDGFGQAH